VTIPTGIRKLVLSAHLTLSVGWIGAIAAYTALDLTAATSHDPQTLRAAYLGMGLIAGTVIVPLAIASLITGVVVSIGTKWGLFRHWWVVISLVLTTFASVVLMVETRTINALAAMAADPTTSTNDLRSMGSTLVHSIGGTVVLLMVLVLNVYKPRGLTPYGWRKRREERRALHTSALTEPDP
jgi:hypothetical protein